MREGERFTEEIGVLETLGGDEKDLQLPVNHVCRCLCSSSIDDCSFLMRCSCREREERFRGSEATALSPWRPNQSKCDIYGEKKSWQIVTRSHAVAGRPAPAWQLWIINHACLPVCITHVILIVMVIYYEPWLVNLEKKDGK